MYYSCVAWCFCQTQRRELEAISYVFLHAYGNLVLLLGCLVHLEYAGRYLILLQLDISCTVGIPGRTDLF